MPHSEILKDTIPSLTEDGTVNITVDSKASWEDGGSVWIQPVDSGIHW